MEHTRLTDNEFEQLWQEAGARGQGQRLAKEYPAWRQQWRHTMSVAASLVVLVGVAVPLLSQPVTSPEYLGVCCNQSGIDDAQWASLATDLLMEG